MRRPRHLIPIAAAATMLAAPLKALADDPPVEEQIVDALQALFGQHPGQRSNHAKGLVAEGSFAASPDAASLTRAPHLQGGTVPVTVRFSDATGIPDIPDGDPNANPHGLAVKFHLPDGTDTDIVTNSLHFFPVATPAEFRDFLLAAGATKPDSPKPTKLDAFLASHPTASRAGATVATPASYATEEYFGIDAFRFTNKAGERHFIRYRLEPVAGVSHIERDEAAKRPPDFLADEIKERLGRGPVRFRLLAQVAAPGDTTTDATVPWPEDRPRVELGMLTIAALVSDNEAAARKLLFLPGQVADGIEPSDDPLLPARGGAYAISFSRRSE